MSKSAKNTLLHKIFVANILLGIAFFIGAVYFIVAGDYANLASRQQNETILNTLCIGGILYSVTFWYIDLYFHPQFPDTDS